MEWNQTEKKDKYENRKTTKAKIKIGQKHEEEFSSNAKIGDGKMLEVFPSCRFSFVSTQRKCVGCCVRLNLQREFLLILCMGMCGVGKIFLTRHIHA